jgi:choline dehydrogenase-like flavoprotein
MIADFREAEHGAAITADICVIGAGAAGITVARSFIGTRLQVCVLESGGFELDSDTQSLYEGDSVGEPYFGLEVSRQRLFGGTTFHWAGWTTVLNSADFEPRSWVPHSGWPIGGADLKSYYPQAQIICNGISFPYDERLWPELDVERPALDESKLRARFWQQRWDNIHRFGSMFRKELQDATNIRILLNANVVNIQADAAGKSIEHVDVRAFGGKAAQAKARVYILACGGIENARLLLLSNGVQSNGLGNANDLVGRYFMEHLGVRFATVLASDPMKFLTTFTRHRLTGGVMAWAGFGLAEPLQRRAETLNCAATVSSKAAPESGPESARAIWRSISKGRVPPDLGRHLATVIADFDDVVVQTYRRVMHGDEAVMVPKEIYLNYEGEQAPNPESRITLSEKRDLLGQRQPVLDWRRSEIDKHSIRVIATAIGEELGRLNLARVRLDDWLLDQSNAWPDSLQGKYHHIGTTRMSSDPKTGVVDRNCAVHGIDNLYAAGSSVFPTSGYAVPTLTIVALALRLADHLRSQLH